MPIQGIRTRISEGPLKTSSLRDEKEETNEAKKAPSLIQLGNSGQL